jgi:hypothetical protein
MSFVPKAVDYIMTEVKRELLMVNSADQEAAGIARNERP